MKEPVSKGKVESDKGRDLMSTLGSPYECTPMRACNNTQTHTFKNRNKNKLVKCKRTDQIKVGWKKRKRCNNRKAEPGSEWGQRVSVCHPNAHSALAANVSSNALGRKASKADNISFGIRRSAQSRRGKRKASLMANLPPSGWRDEGWSQLCDCVWNNNFTWER